MKSHAHVEFMFNTSAKFQTWKIKQIARQGNNLFIYLFSHTKT